jgi:hypothetical protein
LCVAFYIEVPDRDQAKRNLAEKVMDPDGQAVLFNALTTLTNDTNRLLRSTGFTSGRLSVTQGGELRWELLHRSSSC